MATTATTQFLLVTYDPGSLFAMWRGVSVAGLSGYRIFVGPAQGPAQAFDQPVSPNNATISITVQVGDVISIAVLVDGEPGPQSTPLALITAAANMLSMAYDVVPAAQLTLLWQVVNQSAVSGYVVVLAEVGTSNQQTRAVTEPPAVFTGALDPAHSYQATIRATGSNGVVQGPSSVPLTAITASTQVLSMIYDLSPAAKLSLMWTPVNAAGVTGYVVVLRDGTGDQWTQNPASTRTEFDQVLDPAKDYQATVRASGANGVVQGPATTPLTAITASTQMHSMIYDLAPAAMLSLAWQPVNNSLVTGYVAVLQEVGTGNQWSKTPSAAAAEFVQTLDPAHSYQATVRATSGNGVVQGPATAPLAAITAPTQVLSMVYDTAPSAVLTMTWQAVNQGGVTGYVAVLSEVGTSNRWIATPASARAQFTQTLDNAQAYQATVRAAGDNGVVQGPASAPLTAITASTQMLSMTYALSPSPLLGLTWQAASQPAVTGYVAVLREVGSGNQWSKTPSAAAAEFAQTLDPAQSYQATVRATGDNGVVQGPATVPLTAITAQPTLTGLDYNPNAFVVSWNRIVQAAITGYQVTVTLGMEHAPYPVGDTGQVTLPITLDPAQAYSVAVAATGAQGVVTGPPSAALAPLLTSPTSTTLIYNGHAFSTGWVADHNPAVSGYIAQLLMNGASADQQELPASPATFSDPFTAGKVYSSQVRSTGTKVKGPWTAQAPGPYRSVATLTHDGLGRLTTIARLNAATTVFTFDSFGNIETVRNTDSAPGP